MLPEDEDPETRWDGWLDLVAGSACVGCARPGRLVCRACAADLPRQGRQVRPDPCPAGLAPAYAGGEYAGLLRSMVLAHKERRAFALARPLGEVLAAAVPASTVDGHLLLVPVPSRRVVVTGRGHDPLLRFTRVAAARLRRTGASAEVARLLRPSAPVRDQSELDAVARQANLAGSMAARAGPLRALAREGHPCAAVVCDDVLTTGATVREAQRALNEVGVPVAAIAVVAATRRRRPTSTGRGR